MEIRNHPNPDRGVTSLMYVGHDGLDGVLGSTPWSERAPKLVVAGGLLALVLWVAFKRR
jgi:hypothetical protein